MGKYIDIISRRVWGNSYGLGWGKRPLPAEHVILHHTETNAPPVGATLEQDIKAVKYVDYIGYTRFNYAGEQAGISYTWVVPPSGRVFEGHDVERQASHTAGHNYSGVGIALIGNYDNDLVNEKQIDAIARLLLEAQANGLIKNAKVDFNHNDTFNTACPGKNALRAREAINARVKKIKEGTDKPVVVEPPADPNQGFTSAYITDIQSSLARLSYYNGRLSGHLPDVSGAVKSFQTDNGLTADGLPGSTTKGVIETRLAKLAAREEAERLKREKTEKAAVLKFIADNRVSGADRWETARAVANLDLPAGRGILVAADGTPDERYAATRARDNVRYAPVRPGSVNVPKATLDIISDFKPEWVKVVGGQVTDECARTIFIAAGLI